MMRGWVHRAARAAIAAAVALPLWAPAPGHAGEQVIRVGGDEHTSRPLSFGKGKSVVIELPRDAKDVLVADPRVANAVVRSARRAFLVGVDQGQTNVVFFDIDGQQIASFDITVGFDSAALQATLRRLLPNADIRVDQAGGKAVVLSGTVANAADAAQAVNVAAMFLNQNGGGDPGAANGPAKNVINALTIKAKEQVMLKVVVSEVQRSVIKQFGVDLKGSIDAGTVVDFATVNAPGIVGKWLTDTQINTNMTFRSGQSWLDAKLRALEQAGAMRTLAEPNLTAISGEAAKFLAGGEFPVVTGWDSLTGYQVQWKQFGVMLDFTPVVLSEGRISLRMATEVSELDPNNGVSIGEKLQIPGVKVRRASSTLELSSGGSIVLAGLIKEETRQAMNGLPGLQSIPVLGTLFRSRDFQNGQTELMIIVTPYVVNSVARRQLQTPDDGFAPASDPASVFLGRINRIYGVAGKIDPTRPYHGTYGFIID